MPFRIFRLKLENHIRLRNLLIEQSSRPSKQNETQLVQIKSSRDLIYDLCEDFEETSRIFLSFNKTQKYFYLKDTSKHVIASIKILDKNQAVELIKLELKTDFLKNIPIANKNANKS